MFYVIKYYINIMICDTKQWGTHDFQIKWSSFGDISDISRNYNKKLCKVIGHFNKTFFYFFMLFTKKTKKKKTTLRQKLNFVWFAF